MTTMLHGSTVMIEAERGEPSEHHLPINSPGPAHRARPRSVFGRVIHPYATRERQVDRVGDISFADDHRVLGKAANLADGG